MEPFAVYKKAIKGKVSGRTINKRGDEEDFLLVGDISDPNVDEFDTIVELWSEDDDRWFRRYNRQAIKKGYLIKIRGTSPTVRSVNAPTDGELKDILKLPYRSMVKKINEFTSDVPVIRLLEFAKEADKPIKTIEYIQNKIEELRGK